MTWLALGEKPIQIRQQNSNSLPIQPGFARTQRAIPLSFPKDLKNIHISSEMAHIFAATDGGPRTKEELSEEERGSYENIILLCANCHTLIDKTPDEHPAELMTTWKREHALKRERAFGVATLSSREELRKAILALLSENAVVHQEVGPDNNYRFNPEASEAAAWRERVKRTIIPNSLKILMVSDVNSNLLNEGELVTLEKFRYHVQGLVMRHLEGQDLPNSRFPTEMQNIGK
ncbi:MAG: hypothetical protein E5W15_06055 [Mesorhizobium sp.]|uniref:HNH endonuclease n=2 Tax=Mesorhizobium TaxID=68287 RepID=UPI000FCBBBA5|nr:MULTISPECIES: HNH endonuclease [unclassified Mesorhizobium]RUW40648.1 hypothetical protein EOA37_13890 [Mesorhizobium sp. M2A.F.Ca.ET.015.02.1.1]RVC95255.1 hypothetical protein EN739_13840 [Mesorhizobium sp. M2A.F.Ca.ET.017.03.2.1]RVD10824.1 hypothetical protein EN753_04935 [Mesorhizobium sp. M2A.F.Ca.ET.029.05.1.1]RWB42515.1 MAG: hypothetical protein EOQ46_18875 [Mesorhizobium sp.]RWB61127.1 MAG: hypothetical protein EOQ48_15310 [Mesorhizobium sp.]